MLAQLGLVVGVLGCGDAVSTPTPPPPDAGAPDAGAPDAGPTCAASAAPGPRWTRVDFAEHPALRTVGGAAVIDVPAEQLYVGIVRTSPECAVVVWSICPHGACFVGWHAADREWVCPCHGSRFAEDGALLTGPADRALRRFEAVVEDDHLWVRGPRA